MFWHHISALQYCNSTTITNYRLFTGHESGHINRVILLQGAGRWLGVGGGWSLVNNMLSIMQQSHRDHWTISIVVTFRGPP